MKRSSPSTSPPAPIFSEDKSAKIECILRCESLGAATPGIVDRLQKYVQQRETEHHPIDIIRGLKTIKNEAQATAKAMARLRRALSSTDIGTVVGGIPAHAAMGVLARPSILASVGMDFLSDWRTDEPAGYATIEQNASMLSDAAQRALQEYKDRGPSIDWNRRFLIAELMRIYSERTGLPPRVWAKSDGSGEFGGVFLDLATIVLRAYVVRVGDRVKQGSALGRELRRLINDAADRQSGVNLISVAIDAHNDEYTYVERATLEIEARNQRGAVFAALATPDRRRPTLASNVSVMGVEKIEDASQE